MKMFDELVSDMRRWGKVATRRVLALTKKHGVLCSGSNWSDGKKG